MKLINSCSVFDCLRASETDEAFFVQLEEVFTVKLMQ